jgi:hypothetical protein
MTETKDAHPEFYIIPGNHSDRQLAMKWATDEFNWNHGTADYDVWIKCLPEEQFMAAKDVNS